MTQEGETTPNTDTLKLLSKLFDVSINTLLGSPRELICQCCGMPLKDDDIISRDADGSPNEDYCRWTMLRDSCKHEIWHEFLKRKAREDFSNTLCCCTHFSTIYSIKKE